MEVKEQVDPRELLQELFRMDKYRERLSQMALEGSTSLMVDFEDIHALDEELARGFIRNPTVYLGYANHAAYEQLKMEAPDYAAEVEGVTVRIRSLPVATGLRELGSSHIGKLVMVEGIVVRATPVEPMVLRAAYKCLKCGEITYVEPTGTSLTPPTTCTNPTCKRRGPFELVEEATTFVDFQQIRIQELSLIHI